MVRCGLVGQRQVGCWLGIAAALCVQADAHAQVRWHGSLGLTSDYVQTGLSQTRGAPALQGGLRADVGTGWSFGVWGSQIDRNRGPGATYELDAYAARAWQLSPDWIATVTATHYFYPNDTPVLRYDYDEVAVSLGYRSSLFATVTWSPNTSEGTQTYLAAEERALSYEVTMNRPVVGAWSANAGAGYRDLTALFEESYWYGHAGVSYAAGSMSLHLTYTRADETARRLFGEERAANTVLGAVIFRFGSAD